MGSQASSRTTAPCASTHLAAAAGAPAGVHAVTVVHLIVLSTLLILLLNVLQRGAGRQGQAGLLSGGEGVLWSLKARWVLRRSWQSRTPLQRGAHEQGQGPLQCALQAAPTPLSMLVCRDVVVGSGWAGAAGAAAAAARPLVGTAAGTQAAAVAAAGGDASSTVGSAMGWGWWAGLARPLAAPAVVVGAAAGLSAVAAPPPPPALTGCVGCSSKPLPAPGSSSAVASSDASSAAGAGSRQAGEVGAAARQVGAGASAEGAVGAASSSSWVLGSTSEPISSPMAASRSTAGSWGQLAAAARGELAAMGLAVGGAAGAEGWAARVGSWDGLSFLAAGVSASAACKAMWGAGEGHTL
jgi:hypothetical protein